MTRARSKAGKPSDADPLAGLGHGWIVEIADYAQTFEIREGSNKPVRKSPVLYSKWYGGANDEPSACYMRRLDKLTRRPDGLLLEGGWGRFLREGGRHTPAYRGFLTNDQSRAANLSEIAGQILYCDESQARDIVLGVLDVGLIRIVREPDWNKRREELEPVPEESKDENASGKKPPKAKGKKKPRTGRQKSAFQKNPETSGKIPEPSRIEVNGMAIDSTVDESTGMATDSAVGESNAMPGKPPENTLRGATAPKAQAPPRDTRGPEIVRLADALPRAVDGLARGYALGADDFAGEIFALLQCPMDRDTLDGRRELGNFRAALLAAVDAGLSPSQLDEIIGKGKADAVRIGRQRKRHYANGGSPEKYWRFQWGKHMDARRSGRLARGAG
ncbi:MAG: hypothetical protein RBS72_18105 [Sedimentisphaerales bacterium]|jgi:hypothetical protein|nr:hypothetical protein [Sedimentisphaerales bacterium]HOC63662.1 hypothetical protein [Sedimentisphaerales bacterium]HOH64399.1 hypothetical protein [Sedimentisphaerales bacterium]